MQHSLPPTRHTHVVMKVMSVLPCITYYHHSTTMVQSMLPASGPAAACPAGGCWPAGWLPPGCQSPPCQLAPPSGDIRSRAAHSLYSGFLGSDACMPHPSGEALHNHPQHQRAQLYNDNNNNNNNNNTNNNDAVVDNINDNILIMPALPDWPAINTLSSLWIPW